MSCDWETVKNVVQGNSSIKPDQTGGDGKGVKQSEMFNYSVYTIVKGLSNQVPEIRCACAQGCSYKRKLYTNMKPIQFSIN